MKYKLLYFDIKSSECRQKFTELLSSLDDLGIKYEYSKHYITCVKSKRALLYNDSPTDIRYSLSKTQIYERPRNLPEYILDWVSESVSITVIYGDLDD